MFAMVWIAVVLGAVASGASADDSPDVPAPLRPFGHLIGGWKGQAVPQANRLKGWTEQHDWAWAFEKGRPVGLSLTLEGNRFLRRGRLGFDPARKVYRLEGEDAQGNPVVYQGPIDAAGRVLVLGRVGTVEGGGQERLTLRLNSNQIRYVLLLEAKPKRAPQYSKVIDINLGKEGEAFAAGGSATDLPKCVLTGGAAGMTVSYNGRSYPVCCTGCRDEFLADPERYVKKASGRAAEGGAPRGIE